MTGVWVSADVDEVDADLANEPGRRIHSAHLFCALRLGDVLSALEVPRMSQVSAEMAYALTPQRILGVSSIGKGRRDIRLQATHTVGKHEPQA